MQDDWARPVVHWEIVALDPDLLRAFYRQLFNWEIGDGTIMEIAPGAGDPIVPVSRPAHPVTVGLIAHLNHADRQLAALLMDAVQAGLSPNEWEALLGRFDGGLLLPPGPP